MKIQQAILQGAAVHTRGLRPGEDYKWAVTTGELLLFDKIDHIHRLSLRDVGGEVPLFCVILEQKRVGLLMGDLASSRIDHSGRVIYNTLYLEFEETYQRYVLEAVASLLLCSKNTYIPHAQHFNHYAEMLLDKTPLATINLPAMYKQPDSQFKKITSEKMILCSNIENLNRSASYLNTFKPHANKNFFFISTGRVGLVKCQQVVKNFQQCLMLTLSSEVVSDVELKKGGLSLFGKK